MSIPFPKQHRAKWQTPGIYTTTDGDALKESTPNYVGLRPPSPYEKILNST